MANHQGLCRLHLVMQGEILNIMSRRLLLVSALLLQACSHCHHAYCYVVCCYIAVGLQGACWHACPLHASLHVGNKSTVMPANSLLHIQRECV